MTEEVPYLYLISFVCKFCCPLSICPFVFRHIMCFLIVLRFQRFAPLNIPLYSHKHEHYKTVIPIMLNLIEWQNLKKVYTCSVLLQTSLGHVSCGTRRAGGYLCTGQLCASWSTLFHCMGLSVDQRFFLIHEYTVKPL